MRVVFRADASVEQGSGHVMRCLTLAEAFLAHHDEVVFASAIDSVPWLSEHLIAGGSQLLPVDAHSLDSNAVLALEPDWVVVDSYLIDPADISALAQRVPVLAIVDGDTRGIEATLYLDQNLGAQEVAGRERRSLAGASYALIRDAVLEARREEPWLLSGMPRLTAFMGGTDPGGAIVAVARELARVTDPFDLVVVCPVVHHASVVAALGDRVTVLAPTPNLPAILARSDVIISAAGTSAWDICTLGVPALLVGVVDNQSAGLASAVSDELVLGVDLTRGGNVRDIAPAVRSLLSDRPLRERLSRRSTAVFDGKGKQRVLEAMLAMTADSL